MKSIKSFKIITVIFLSVLFGKTSNVQAMLPKSESGKAIITLVQGDLVQQSFDDPKHSAIVNAANPSLGGGGGITGIIWNTAGSLTKLGTAALNDPKNKDKVENGKLKIGQAVVTTSQNLFTRNNNKVKWVIHTPGPSLGSRGNQPTKTHEQELRNSYYNSLKVADDENIHTIAFPTISVGLYYYPFLKGTQTAIKAVVDYLKDNPQTKIKEVRFVLFHRYSSGNESGYQSAQQTRDAYVAELKTALVEVDDVTKLDIYQNLKSSTKHATISPQAFQLK